MYWCWWDFHQERFLSSWPVFLSKGRERLTAEEGIAYFSGSSSGTWENQIQEPAPWLRASCTSQSPRNWPCPRALYYSWIGLFQSFFCRTFWKALSLCWCRTEKSLKSRKSLGTGSLFLSQLFISVSFTWRRWFNKNWRYQRKRLQRTTLLNPPLHNSLENINQCQYPN